MAVVHDSSAGVIGLATSPAAASSPQAANFTNTAGNLLTVGVGYGLQTAVGNQATINGVSYGGNACTKLVSQRVGTNSESIQEIWYLLNPPTGVNSLSVSFSETGTSNNHTLWAGATSFSGAGTPVEGVGTSSNSASVLSLATSAIVPVGDMAIGIYGNGAGAGGTYTQTATWTAFDNGTTQLGAGHGARASGAGSTITFQETPLSSDSCIVLVARIPAAGASVPTFQPHRMPLGV